MVVLYKSWLVRRIDLESFERYRFIFWNILKILENKKFKKVVDKQMTVWYYKWAVADNKDSNELKMNIEN